MTDVESGDNKLARVKWRETVKVKEIDKYQNNEVNQEVYFREKVMHIERVLCDFRRGAS